MTPSYVASRPLDESFIVEIVIEFASMWPLLMAKTAFAPLAFVVRMTLLSVADDSLPMTTTPELRP